MPGATGTPAAPDATPLGDQDEWHCPACGKPDSQLPIGHALGLPMDGGEPTCMVIKPDPGIIDRWLGRA